MKRSILIFAGLLIVSLFTLNVYASNIAFVNLGKAIQTCKAGSDAKSSIQRMVKVKKTVIDRKANAVKAIYKQIKSGKLNAKEKESKEELYKTKLEDLKMYRSDAMSEIKTKEQNLTRDIIQGLVQTVKIIAKKRNLDAVFETNQSVVYWNDAKDITKDVIAAYNKVYTKSKK